MIDLSNKTILVTGASKGIGAAIVNNLSKSNANIIAQYCSDKTGMEEVISSSAEANIVTFQADFKKVTEVENLWEKAIRWRNGVDVLINNAAIIRFEGGIDDSDLIWKKTWDDTLAVNLMAPCNLMKKAVSHYKKKGGAMKEWVPPSDLANLVSYLSSGSCRHLTGATLDVNGASYLR